jgi:hypothetical protein
MISIIFVCFFLISFLRFITPIEKDIRKDLKNTELPSEISPFNQHLPDCTKPFDRLQKKTNAKIMLCPMIK